MTRYIGIRHRRKETTTHEIRPTMVAIADGVNDRTLEFTTDDEELDFVLGKHPVRWRKISESDDLSEINPRHLKWHTPEEGETISEWLLRHADDRGRVPSQIPTHYEGLQPGDVVAMVLGGSGDRLAFALSRRGKELTPHARTLRIPAIRVASLRSGDDKDVDPILLARLAQTTPHLFYEIGPRDRKIVALVEAYRDRMDTMRARIACETRLRQRLVGRIFCSESGGYPEGSIEDAYDAAKANDAILQALVAEEKKCDRVLAKAAEALDVYTTLFGKIEGVGPAIGAGLIAAIQDIRRFPTDAKLKAFLGVHMLADGRFARQRHGEVANWSPGGRQALYLLGDQFNRRPGTKWGDLLREYKRKFREKYPEPVTNPATDKLRYTDAHIHRMAIWRTLTKFVEWLWKEWTRLERRAPGIAESETA